MKQRTGGPALFQIFLMSPVRLSPTEKEKEDDSHEKVPDVTEDDFTESESESWGNDEDDSNNEQEASDKDSGQEYESEDQESNSEQDEEFDNDNQEKEEVNQENEYEDDEIESDEDKGMDDTTDQFDDDVDARLKEPTQTDNEVKTEVPATSSSRSSNLASTFLNFLDIPHNNAEIVSPLDVHVHHEVPRTQAPTRTTIPVSVTLYPSP
ncbi:hypothetical protein Tco_0741585 [Tanacetum coccineum]